MPQVIVNNSQIETFSFTVKFDIRNLSVVFDISDTVFNGTGVSDCQGIVFSIVDQGGVSVLSYDWDNPAIPTPSTDENPVYLGESTYTADLSETFFYSLFFQKWRIKGAVKDGDGNIFETSLAIWDLCMPEGFTDSGYVKGTFLVKLDCPNATVTVKDLTVVTYRKEEAYETTNTGVLYYPVGTVDPVEFSSTPFRNNVVYTGNYRLVNTLIALFDLGNGGIVQVEYYTANNWDFDCENNMANILCCVYELYVRGEKNCNNAIGKEAKQQLADISPIMWIGFMKEQSGQDASVEAKTIREKLRCDCGKQGVRKVSVDPVNAAVYDIVITDQGGTTVTSSVSGNTKTYLISSRVYQVTKGDLNDQAFTIALDTQTPYVTKYVITFDYEVMAGYILTEISGNQTLITQLNSLISNNFIDLENLNGRCVIDIDAANYFLTYRVPSSSNTVNSIRINSTDNALGDIVVTNAVAIENALNALGLGTFEVSYSSSSSGTFLNILTTANTYDPENVTFGVGSVEIDIDFQQTSVSLIAVLQALVDYMCDLSAAGIQLGEAITVCSIEDDEASDTVLGSSATQAALNSAFSIALCAIRTSVLTFTSTTCAQIRALFVDRPSSVADSSARVYGINSSSQCTAFTMRQLALGIISQIKNDSTVFNAYCTIDDCGDPVACPDIIGASVIQLGGDIVLQSVDWDAFTDTTQTITVKYRLQGDPSYITVTASLTVQADGDVTPNLTVLENATVGEIYEVYVLNNCGGDGYVATVEIETCPDPENLEAIFLEETSAGALYTERISWEGDEAGEYSVEYVESPGTSWIEAPGSPVTGLSIDIENLEYGVEYDVRVQRVCDTSSQSAWVETTFIEVSGDFSVQNNDEDSSITSVQLDGQNIVDFLNVESGSLPLANGEAIAGTLNENFTGGVLEVGITTTSVDSSLVLTINNVFVECVPVSGSDNYEFSPQDYNMGDLVEIVLEVGSCS